MDFGDLVRKRILLRSVLSATLSVFFTIFGLILCVFARSFLATSPETPLLMGEFLIGLGIASLPIAPILWRQLPDYPTSLDVDEMALYFGFPGGRRIAASWKDPTLKLDFFSMNPPSPGSRYHLIGLRVKASNLRVGIGLASRAPMPGHVLPSVVAAARRAGCRIATSAADPSALGSREYTWILGVGSTEKVPSYVEADDDGQ